MTGEPVGLTTVRRQLARPAVDRRVLDQIICTPPVLEERADSLEEVMLVSRSAMREVASCSFLDSKSCFFAFANRFSSRTRSFSAFSGLRCGDLDFLGEEQGLGRLSELLCRSSVGVSSSSSSESIHSKNRFLRGLVIGAFFGEYVSCHVFTTSRSQKPSMLWRCGEC